MKIKFNLVSFRISNLKTHNRRKQTLLSVSIFFVISSVYFHILIANLKNGYINTISLTHNNPFVYFMHIIETKTEHQSSVFEDQ